MNSLLTLSASSDDRVRLLQITDTHLFADESAELLGVATCHSYRAVIDAIIKQNTNGDLPKIDLLVATGDLAQDQSYGAYNYFAQGIAKFIAPCVWLPGNHDFQPIMIKTLADAGISDAKHVLIGQQWQLILLDSQVEGVPFGQLSTEQLEYLDALLTRYPDRHSLILLHHHPLAIGCDWLDQHCLHNASALDEVLTRHQDPRGEIKVTLLCGHIHQALDVDWQGRRVLASPSTCVQFKPNSREFAVDNVSPGWRYLDLLPNGTLETTLYRLPDNQFSPDMDSQGY